jgi:Flp pilus assembly protein TadD
MPGATEYDLGMEMHGRDRYDEARAAFEKAIELGYKPDSSAYNIACGYALRGDASNAIRWLDDAVARGYDDVDHLEADSDLDPIRSDARFRGLVRDLRAKQGYRGAGRDRVTEARERVDGLRMNRSPNADEWADAGTELLRLRELDPSIDAFNEAIRLNPENWLPRYNLGCALSIKGDHPAALDALEGAILAGFEGREKLENDPDLKSVRADARFAELLKLNDALALWIGGKEKKHVEKREVFREAIPRFEEAVRLYPKSGRAWFNLGFASLSNRDFNTARDSFQRSLSLGYRGGTTMYNLACVEALAGNRDAAFEWLQKAESTGFNLSHMKGDDDLDSLRDDPRFDEMLERAWRQEEAKERIKERRKETSKRVEFGRAGGWDAI